MLGGAGAQPSPELSVSNLEGFRNTRYKTNTVRICKTGARAARPGNGAIYGPTNELGHTSLCDGRYAQSPHRANRQAESRSADDKAADNSIKNRYAGR